MQQQLKNRPILKPRSDDFFKPALMGYLGKDRINLKVHKFSREALIGTDIVTDFCTRYLPREMQKGLTRIKDDKNKSLSAEAMALLADIRSGEAAKNRPSLTRVQNVLDIIRHCDQKIAGFSRPSFRPVVAAAVYDRRTDLGWVKDTFGLTFERPAATEVIAVTQDDLSSVNRICSVNEDRLSRLADAVVKAQQDQVGLFLRKFKREMQRWGTKLRGFKG